VSRFLIVTADDFGLHTSVNEAVERASHAGVLTAASLMVGAPAAEDAVRRARNLPNLRVGLHLVLTDGCSILPQQRIASLVDANGRFRNRMFIDAIRFFALPQVRAQLEAEIRAQFESFAATGLPLDHVNAHKHFHLHPTLMTMLLRIGHDYGLGAAGTHRVGVRIPDEPLWNAHPTALLLLPWLRLMKRRLRSARIPYNDHVFGIADSGHMSEQRLLRMLARLPSGVTEIYLHPATQSGSDISASMSGYRHADEFAALMSPRVHAAIAAIDVSRGGYSDC
jgi:hopanoid biosynthesis associated protein HpnK